MTFMTVNCMIYAVTIQFLPSSGVKLLEDCLINSLITLWFRFLSLIVELTTINGLQLVAQIINSLCWNRFRVFVLFTMLLKGFKPINISPPIIYLLWRKYGKLVAMLYMLLQTLLIDIKLILELSFSLEIKVILIILINLKQ